MKFGAKNPHWATRPIDWTVTTAINPPEGFVADQASLTQAVNGEVRALQFTLRDSGVGSTWKETKVKHKVKHKGKTETVSSKVDVRLSEKLAKKKGLSPYGQGNKPW